MADVFISYARKDKEFVRRLHDALQGRGRNAWVDWEGIPPSAEWLGEIYSAIEAADTVVFVISPQSATSKICSAELAHAVQCNKRIVPILREDIRDIDLPKALRERNWVFLRESDDFDLGFALLMEAVDTDLEWVRAHTRLLTRAVEWDGNGRDSSFALRGSDLQKAESYLTARDDKEPRLGPLQIEYILASRRDVAKRRTVAIGSAFAALVVVAVVGLLLVQKRHESNLNLAAGFRDKGISELANNNPSSAEIWLARALAINDALDARQFLLEARAKSPRLTWTSPLFSDKTMLAISGDGAVFAIKAKTAVEIWNSSARQPFRSIAADKPAQRVAFSWSHRLLAISDGDTIEVWDLDLGARPPIAILKGESDVSSLAFSPTGLLLSGSNDGRISLWDIFDHDETPRFVLRGHADSVVSMAVSSDDRFLVSGSSDDTARVWDLVERRELRKFTGHSDSVHSVAISPDDELVASGGWDSSIWIWELKTGRKLRSMNGHRSSILSLAFSRDGNRLVSTSADRTARLWDVDRGTDLAVLPTHQGDIVAVAFTSSAGHEALLTGEMAGTARIWDIDDIGQRDELITFHGHQGSVTMFGFDLSRSLVISASIDKTIRLWSLETRKNVGLFQGHQSNVAALKLSPDGRHVASASRDSTVRIWETETGRVQILPHAANGETLYIRAIAYSPDGRLLVSGSEDGKIRIWDAASGKLVHAFLAHSERIMALAFSPNGKLLASSGDDTATIKLWRADDWTPAPGLVGHDSRVYQMTFSPDSRLLLSVSDDKTARLWDVESKKELLNPIKHDSPVWSADFSADGKMIATGCQDWTVHLWNLDSDGGTRNLSNHFVVRIADGPVWHVAFNRDPENPSLGIAGQDKTVRILDLRRLSILFAQPAQLETEADERSGLQIHSVDNEFSLVPTRRE